jgi:xylulokinase
MNRSSRDLEGKPGGGIALSLMGLDVGTSGCKALVFSPEGRVISYGYREYPLVHPRPGWSELDPELLWRSIEDVVTESVAGAGGDGVTAVSVSVQGEAVIPVASDRRALYNFVVTFDDRTIPQWKWWEKTLGRERIFDITGMPLHPMYSLNKIMWFRENLPQLFKQAWKFLCVEDFVFCRLGLEPTIDFSLAARTMAFDVRGEGWSAEMLSLAGIDETLLSRVKPSGSVVGEIPGSVAERLGLARGAVAVTGGHDQCCGILGAGVVREGLAMNATGTSDVLNPVFARPVMSGGMLERNYCCYHHTKPGMYTSCAFNLTGGLLLRWYRDAFCAEEVRDAKKTGKDAYELIIAGAKREPASVFILPHFVGSGTPTLDPRSKGAILGLTLETGRSDISKAVLDSTNYELKLNIDAYEQIGIPIAEVRAVGGGAKSDMWLQLKADVFGKPVVSLEISEAACLGAALLAGTATGAYDSVDEGAALAVKTKRVFEPRKAEHEKYREKYNLYRKIYPALSQLNREM